MTGLPSASMTIAPAPNAVDQVVAASDSVEDCGRSSFTSADVDSARRAQIVPQATFITSRIESAARLTASGSAGSAPSMLAATVRPSETGAITFKRNDAAAPRQTIEQWIASSGAAGG